MKPAKLNRGRRREPPPGGARAEPLGFANVRFVGDGGDEILTRFLGEPPAHAIPVSGSNEGVCLSGGGAGALVGLSQIGQRPQFADGRVRQPSRYLPAHANPGRKRGRHYEEMHVDGGAITPLFVVSDALMLRRAQDLHSEPVEDYALFNSTLEPSLRTISLSAVPILVRSILAELCAASVLRFDLAAMSEMFAHEVKLAQGGRRWTSALSPRAAD